MKESEITNDDLLRQGYTKTKEGDKFTKKVGDQDVELIRNGKGVLPQIKHKNSIGNHTLEGITRYRQVDDSEELNKIEKDIKSSSSDTEVKK